VAGGPTLEPVDRITIQPAAVRQVAVHAHESWPFECCGLLIGTAVAIETVYRARNVHESRIRYLVCPEDHFAAIRLARANGLDVVGAYHSHPAGRPRPSAVDRDEAQGDGFTYVIAGTRRLRRASWGRGLRSREAHGYWGATQRARRSRRHLRSVEAQGHWMAAWRLVGGNFTQVPLVRLR
jgi:proteasome lid subunit RPN8/RPN11